MRPLRVTALLAPGLLLIVQAAASADVPFPDPAHCLVELQYNDSNTLREPALITVVPGNGAAPQPRAEIQVTVRDLAGNLMNNAQVYVIFSPAANGALCWCSTQNQPMYILPDGRRIFYLDTPSSGFVEFQINAGGCFQGGLGTVEIRGNAPGANNPNVAHILRSYGVVASFDNSGSNQAPCDGTVNTADLSLYAQRHLGLAPYAPCYDYNGDGTVNTADLALYGAHHLRSAQCGLR